MDLMKRLALLPVALLALSPSVACADNPPPSATMSSNPADLVRRLGDDSYPVREQASRELLRLGLAARDALLRGAADADPEIRRRCRDLLPNVLEADRQARLEAFIADKEAKQKHDLPGWRRFRQVAGEDEVARQLFIAMCRLDTGFLADTEKDSRRAGDECAILCGQLFSKLYGQESRQTRKVELAEVAPLLLVAGDLRTEMPPQPRQMVVNFLYQPAVRTAMTGTNNPPFKRLVLAWMARQTDDEDAAQQMFFAVQNLEVKEGLDLALQVLKDRPVKGRGLGGAMTTVGKLGDKKNVAALEAFLKDATSVSNFALGRDRGTTEVRDVALAMLVHLTGQDPRGYGFVFAQHNGHLKFYANFLGFADDAQRAKAFAKWQEWKATSK
jgi:hypothetical protein